MNEREGYALLQKIKNKLNNLKHRKKKSGISALFAVWLAVTGVIVITAIADAGMLQMKFAQTSTNVGYVARVLGDQGGLENEPIENYHGEYVTTQQLYQNLNRNMNNAGIPEDRWTLRINGGEVLPNSLIPTQDRGERYHVEIEIDYHWNLVSYFIPGEISGNRVRNTEVITTHRIREGDFQTVDPTEDNGGSWGPSDDVDE